MATITKEIFEQRLQSALQKFRSLHINEVLQAVGVKKEEVEELKKECSSWDAFWRGLDGIELYEDGNAKRLRLKQSFFTTPTNHPQGTSQSDGGEQNSIGINIASRIKALLSYLNQGLYGKEEAVRLALLSAVAKESIFFMGPPGTAKSMISRRLAAAFSDFYKDDEFDVDAGGYFEYLMNEFSTPDEICGPVDLSALNEKPSRYVRQTEGYLPTAKVAFLDEIWKSGPAILNTLLTIINEKKFHNGKKVEKVPLVSLAAASNELPEKNAGLEALWDRFILRVFVNPVEEDREFFSLVDTNAPELKPSKEQLSLLLEISDVEKWQSKIDNVILSDEAKEIIMALRKELVIQNSKSDHQEDEAYYVSDRRWKKIVHVLKTSAFLNGRNAVDLMDCSLIGYAIWNTDKQYEELNKKNGIMEKIFRQNGISATTAIDYISRQIKNFEKSVSLNFYDEVHETGKDNKKNPAKPHLTKKNFAADSLKDAQNRFDSSMYAPIKSRIELEKYRLEAFKKEKEAAFTTNIFADINKYNPVVYGRVDELLRKLDDFMVDLNKQRNRYSGYGN